MGNISYIALALAVFFLLTAVVKGMLARARKRQLESKNSVQNGGSSSPVSLNDPFAKVEPPKIDLHAQTTLLSNTAAVEPESSETQDIYQWK